MTRLTGTNILNFDDILLYATTLSLNARESSSTHPMLEIPPIKGIESRRRSKWSSSTYDFENTSSLGVNRTAIGECELNRASADSIGDGMISGYLNEIRQVPRDNILAVAKPTAQAIFRQVRPHPGAV